MVFSSPLEGGGEQRVGFDRDGLGFRGFRDHFVVDAYGRRTGLSRRLWETRLLGDEVRKNQPYLVNI